MLDAPSHTYLAYRPGVPLAAAVWREGRLTAALPQFLARLPAPADPAVEDP
jgi:hypothetical protein